MVTTQTALAASATKGKNEFSLNDLKVGLEIGGLKVASFGPFSARIGPIAINNLKVSFVGTTTISGNYSPAEALSVSGGSSFTLDDASLQNFPKLTSDLVDVRWFTINGKDADIFAKLGKEKKQATIVIKNYTFVRYPAEVGSTADLVSVK